MPKPSQYAAGNPTVAFELSSGERIMLRRALDLYICRYKAHKLTVKGDPYEEGFDERAIKAAENLSNRILKGQTQWNP